jgi:hypothetical protein
VAPSPDASAFAAIAAQLQCETDEQLAAKSIAQQALELVEDARHVSLTIAPAEGRYETLASTDHTATRADLLQYQLGEGPCLEVAECVSCFRSGDVAADQRWPRWGPEAGRLGLCSVLAVRLVGPGRDTQGALNFYSPDLGAFAEPETVDLAQVYAVHAANALSSAQLATGLQTALTSRHTIGLAQGILMERYGLDQHRSFELLRRTSSVQNVKLRDVAAAVVETGVLPGPTGPPSPMRS